MKDKRTYFTSGAPWEDLVGYSRAVRIGNRMEVSGTVAVDGHGKVVGKGDYYRQTVCVFQKINTILREAGFGVSDVIRTRMFVCDIGKWAEVGKAHREFFDTTRPATSMVAVSALINPDCVVEIEVSAQKSDTPSS